MAKKFGAFSGVFTPSILTILGVIMYLRLGWIVGEAGLIATILIILIAHIISITTGLSISSIATDKKIHVGGIYYILSRSLGLPMGGAIGITIFVGTSLSIALYLVGFAENFLAIDSITTALGIDSSLNTIRIIGTAAIILLVIIAYISTSLAIKSQYVILGAIFISIVAIIVGIFSNTAIQPETFNMAAAPEALPFETIFAIFFPAVTGFTAGVAMSGDLKDPRKAIPKGTLSAILVGLFIYLGLAILLGLFIDREILLGDYNFLMKIAIWSPLVIAGIWGATLSSALGGILGAPRILQAISRDKILPKVFGKGYGANNEPRNALIFTFLLAEVGILIGELDVIARIVTMFYIAAYGFINLAYALESWASSDFRPNFRIPKWVGIIGFIFCFGVMFKLDTVAMVMAIVIMFGIYFFLTKKELQLDFGDVWQSVWASIVRSSLNKIARKGLEDRNWKPNIILFSGGTQTRPYLIDFGKHLVGRQGFLSNFDLIQTDRHEAIVPRHKQLVSDEQSEHTGIFSRKHACNDVYEGIRTISGTYGFSGIEPNTVMMGWARQSEDPEKFLETIDYLKALDLNILLMDYDKRVGFGKYNQIDIWWRTTEQNGNIALMLLKFLWISDEWRNAKARIIIVNPVNDQKEVIQRNTRAILDNMRIPAEIKVINNQLEQRTFYDIVQVESVNSDLIFLGLPEIDKGNAHTFVNETNRLCKDIGTVVLLKASTNFRKLRIGAKRTLLSQLNKLETKIQYSDPTTFKIAQIKYPVKSGLAKQMRLLNADLIEINNYYQTQFLSKLFTFQDSLITSVNEAVEKSFSNISEKVCAESPENQFKTLVKFENNLFFRFRKIITDFEKDIFDIQKTTLNDSIIYYFGEVDKVILNSPKRLRTELSENDLNTNTGDRFARKIFKIRKRVQGKITGKNPSLNINYHQIVSNYLQLNTNRIIFNLLEMWGEATVQNAIKGKQFILDTAIAFFPLEKAALNHSIDAENVNQKKDEITGQLLSLTQINKESGEKITGKLFSDTLEIIQKLSDELDGLHLSGQFKKEYFDTQSRIDVRNFVQSVPGSWQRNQKLLFNSIVLEIGLLSYNTKLRTIFGDVITEIRNNFEELVIKRQLELKTFLIDFTEKFEDDPKARFNPENAGELHQKEAVQIFFNQLIENTFRKIKLATSTLPETVELIDENSMNNFYTQQYRTIEVINISVSQLIDYLLQAEFVEPLQESLSGIPGKLEKLNIEVNGIIRTLTFQFDHEIDKHIDDNSLKESILRQFNEQLAALDKEIEKSKELNQQIINLFRERFNTFEDKLTYHSFIKSATNLKQYIREIESRKRWSILRNSRQRTKLFLQKQVNQFWYRQSQGYMFTQRLRAESTPDRFRVNNVLNLVEQVSIKPEVSKNIPFQYKQLFLRKQYYLNEFWVGRTNELNEASKTIARYKAGLKGGIMVTGDHNSGKTFFSQYFVNRFYRDANVHTLIPPYAGTTDLKVFKEMLENTFEMKGTYYRLFNSLPENSVLIIDDLALWWEKSKDGFQVINLIIDLIEKYGHKCLFIANLNRFSFELINKVSHFENYFLNIIDLSPFSSEDLQKIILARHNSTSLALRLHRPMNETIRSWDFARLFSRYFTYSKGNTGDALQAWLANIGSVEKNMLYINTPRIPDLSSLNYLKAGWYLLIVQLVLHKRANLRKLSRICQSNIQEVKTRVEILKRSGIVVENNIGVYEINSFIYPHLQTILIEKEML